MDLTFRYTIEEPFKILISGCLAGEKVGVDGSSYDGLPAAQELLHLPNVKLIKFCPENFSFGTPRNTPDIHGGDGFDVLDGKAKVFSHLREDWTSEMVNAAREMLRVAQSNAVHVALLTDTSAACGTKTICDGSRFDRTTRARNGPGVCSAMLIRNGIEVWGHHESERINDLLLRLRSHAASN